MPSARLTREEKAPPAHRWTFARATFHRPAIHRAAVALLVAISAPVFAGSANPQSSQTGQTFETGKTFETGQTTMTGQPNTPAFTEPHWVDCARITDPSHRTAIERAHALLQTVWMETPYGWVARYTMPGEVRNPFDRSPQAPDSGTRDGTVQAKPPHCRCHFENTGDRGIVRFVTPFYRFHEAGPGWSPPMRNGLVLEVSVTRNTGSWMASEVLSQKTILLSEQKPRRPEAGELPSNTPWGEPIPGCSRTQRWTGEACVRRKR
jgi:hypothetical protein